MKRAATPEPTNVYVVTSWYGDAYTRRNIEGIFLSYRGALECEIRARADSEAWQRLDDPERTPIPLNTHITSWEVRA